MPSAPAAGKVVFVTSADWNDQLMTRAAEQAGGAVPVDHVIQSLDDLPGGAAPPAQRAKPWGTGHAVLALRDKIDEPFLVVNADDFLRSEGRSSRSAGGSPSC